MPAVIIGLAVTLVAWGSWLLGGASLASLEWGIYDHWLRARGLAPSPDLLLIVRDPAGEARFGAGSWDRAVLARLVTGIASGGAVAIGVDAPLGLPSPPGRGGAASDAMLAQATRLSGALVYPAALEIAGAPAAVEQDRPTSVAGAMPARHVSWIPLTPGAPALLEALAPPAPLPGLAQPARAVGHTLARPEADGVVRQVPLFVRLGDRAVPAFGLALATLFMGAAPEDISIGPDGVVVLRPRVGRRGPVPIPTDDRGRLLVSYTGGSPRGFRAAPFQEVWTAIEEADAEALRRLVDGKVVLLLAEATRGDRRTPVGVAMSDMAIQAHLLNTILTGSWPKRTPAAWTIAGTLVVSSLATAFLLALPVWTGILGVGALTLAYAAGVVLALPLRGLVLPVWLPLSALALASIGAVLWIQLGSARRIRRMEKQMGTLEHNLVLAREAVVRQESTVEALEEDLDAARAAAARAGDAEEELGRAAEALRAHLAEARTQEDRTRERLRALEQELGSLRVGEPRPNDIADAELEPLGRECEQMGIITRDPELLALFRNLKKAARSSLPILLLGEPGTGKELFARAAHQLSPRADRPFVAVNMAAISSELAESELFGHVKGSFTGSVGDRKGYFQLADRGTIFLDEVGDLRPEHQSKLLRVLQEKSFYPVGASRPAAVDVRVIAATNRDLERGVAERWFREDLYFRLKGIVFRLPSLRERPQDVPVLAARFVAEAASEMGRDGLRLSEEALLALTGHQWSGNVRELQHCLHQAIALSEGAVLTKRDLRLPTSGRSGARLSPGAFDPGAEPGSDTFVLASLRQHGFDMQATARALGWDRSTVTQRLKGMGFRALAEVDGDRAKAAQTLAGDSSLARTVELKLREYTEHLVRAIAEFDSPEAALGACRRRFKNLPERYFRSLEVLVRQHFERRRPR